MPRKKKSAFDQINKAFKPKKSGTGLLSSLGNINRRKPRKNRGLLAASGFGKKSGSGMSSIYDRYARKDRRSRGMDGLAARSLKERMTRTEYLKLRDEIDQTIRNDDGLDSEKAQNELIQNEPWYKRVLILTRRRFRKPVL
jgi:hypothetical protein